jgi:hypothetical protein
MKASKRTNDPSRRLTVIPIIGNPIATRATTNPRIMEMATFFGDFSLESMPAMFSLGATLRKGDNPG